MRLRKFSEAGHSNFEQPLAEIALAIPDGQQPPACAPLAGQFTRVRRDFVFLDTN